MSEPTTNALALVEAGDDALQKLPTSKADQIRAVFIPMAEMAEAFDDDFNAIMGEAAEEVTPEVSARARRLRLDIAKVRIQAEHARKDAKAQYLLASQAIDGTARILKWAISEKEGALEKIEKHAELMEKQRIERLQEERAEALAPYVEDAHERNLGEMDDDVWDAYLAAKKQAHEDRLEAERKAEEERKERERIAALDRERTREAAPVYNFLPADVRDELGEMGEDEYEAALADAREAKEEHEAEQARIAKEREELAKQRAAAEKKRKAELARIEKEREAERAKIEAERKKEREAAEKAQREERERVEAERKAEREKLEAEAKAREAEARAEREAAEKRAEAERARLAALVEGAPRVIEAARSMLDYLRVNGPDTDDGEFGRVFAELEEAVNAAAPVTEDEAQLALVEG